jgi:hypothetical protein
VRAPSVDARALLQGWREKNGYLGGNGNFKKIEGVGEKSGPNVSTYLPTTGNP